MVMLKVRRCCRHMTVVHLSMGWSMVDATLLLLRTELYADFCGDLKASYETYLNECYNGGRLFHNSEDWGDNDILDSISSDEEHVYVLHRTFYKSNSSVCEHPVDHYVLPMDECIGPFGKPHPWGKFGLLNTTHDTLMNEIATLN